jgi:uncharacterized protein YndB with AHSA1/START domain
VDSNGFPRHTVELHVRTDKEAPPAVDELRLHLAKTLAAIPTEVFAACAEPGRLAEWWGPAGFTVPSVEWALRPGGRYRIAMQPPDGILFHLTGEFVEIEPPFRLAFTFVWEPPDPDDRETLVTLTFTEAKGGTALAVDHGVFATAARYELHRVGWSEALERLERALATR